MTEWAGSDRSLAAVIERSQGEVVISVKGLAKKFCKNLRRSMTYGIVDLTKDLFGIMPDTTRLRKDEFWAIEEVSFELKKGEVLGVIGVNGAGKSTLLRLLAGIFPPDKGEVSICGRVGALIAVGAGFHPLMTGRENIYLNGTILGMSCKELDENFNDIVDFAEIGDFLDAPVSTYSSGMRVRLGFAIATAIQPDILIVDEVLAVGDAGFRTKALNRMRERFSQSAVIFVSHNMPEVARISSRVLLVNAGRGIMYDNSELAVNDYLSLFEKEPEVVNWSDGDNRIGNVLIRPENGTSDLNVGCDGLIEVEHGQPFSVSIETSLESNYRNVEVNIQFVDAELNTVAICNSQLLNQPLKNPGGQCFASVSFANMLLAPGKFSLNVTIEDIASKKILTRKWHCAPFRVTGSLRSGRYPLIRGDWSFRGV